MFSLSLKKSFALSYKVNATSPLFVVKQFNASANASAAVESHDEDGQREQREAYFEAVIYKTYDISVFNKSQDF